MPPRKARRRGMVAGAAIANSRSKKATHAAPAQTPAPQAEPGPDMTQQLTDLKGLLDKGILTQEEFDAKKKQILGL